MIDQLLAEVTAKDAEIKEARGLMRIADMCRVEAEKECRELRAQADKLAEALQDCWFVD